MSFTIHLNWKRATEDFSYEKFNRQHTLSFSGSQLLANSSAPEYFGNSDTANPEELLGAALCSCHMLTLLAIASKMGYTVDSYEDEASAHLSKNEEGRLAVTEITLKPVIVFSGVKIPDAEQLMALHEKAHRNCFIANSLKTKVTIL